ncbi:MAG: DNA cytosine methyltransferase [Geobacteraceae bacterium]|nr:DNA cytosine methyltransferase [Geobacteraceae bacterium]
MIPVVDIFAGPGGLGEGFTAFGQKENKSYFKIGLSVEKDSAAHRTLLLRSFFRQFSSNGVPSDYYDFLRGSIKMEDLFSRHPKQHEAASNEAILLELGKSAQVDSELDQKIEKIVKNQEKWVLIGGPPCQAYSLIGRSRNAGKKDYRFEDDQRSILYLEYLRILAKHQPPMFVMENVKGLLSAKANGTPLFEYILSDLRNPSSSFPLFPNGKLKYHIYSLVKHPSKGIAGSLSPEDYVVKCELYGIPQSRHRVILLGIREDYASIMPNTLKTDTEVTTKDVLFDLPKLRSGFSRELDSDLAWQSRIKSIAKMPWLNTVEMMYGDNLKKNILCTLSSIPIFSYGRGSDQFINYHSKSDNPLSWWFSDARLKGVCNHSTRGHIFEDIQRYLFASCYAAHKNSSPKLHDYPDELYPKHKNAGTGHFEDRFRVQLASRPSTTITSHISKDGHYYIHPDPKQCRSMTVREAARLQTFPDNYFFCGNRTQQYTQVGNAVPPLLAYKIAEIVHDFMKRA